MAELSVPRTRTRKPAVLPLASVRPSRPRWEWNSQTSRTHRPGPGPCLQAASSPRTRAWSPLWGGQPWPKGIQTATARTWPLRPAGCPSPGQRVGFTLPCCNPWRSGRLGNHPCPSCLSSSVGTVASRRKEDRAQMAGGEDEVFGFGVRKGRGIKEE